MTSATPEQKARGLGNWQQSAPTGLEQEIANFKRDLPGWWFSVGECQVSADASCGPTRESRHIELIQVDPRFDDGFHADLPQPASMADALRVVRLEATIAVRKANRAAALRTKKDHPHE